jgi:alanyl-tRNA synthetase
MVQFKDIFAGLEKASYGSAVTCQKCLRVSGKHNDFEQIGKTRRHHTFFEMLGNFSFGSYFKKEAIQYAWQYLTEILKLPKLHLWVSVHKGDHDALEIWKTHTDIDAGRIVRLGDDTNLWAVGDVGPWGYCSEIFFYIGDKPEAQNLQEFLLDDGTYLEIWNLVFMQYFRNASGSVTDLPLQCIDTGMGLERLVSVIEGVKSNYDISSLRQVIASLENATGITYVGREYDSHNNKNESLRTDTAMRVIADHARAATFLLSEGILPGSEGESYVLRRLLRRAIRFARDLNDAPNLNNISCLISNAATSVISVMGGAYPEILKKKDFILSAINKEEERFHDTLVRGLELLTRSTAKLNVGETLPGSVAFKLYDTYGFPLDITKDVLESKGCKVNESEFTEELKAQKERSRADLVKVRAKEELSGEPTCFIGYQVLSGQSLVQQVVTLGDNLSALVVKETPFYAEMGGQVGDQGKILLEDVTIKVVNTIKSGDVYLHVLEDKFSEESLKDLLLHKTVTLVVDKERRTNIARSHSGTHLLNGALRKVLGAHVGQRGAFCDDTRLRFDFTHGDTVSASEILRIIECIHEDTLSNYEVMTNEMSLDAARDLGAVSAFGEKYGQSVRVVQIGPNSSELCGGTHVARSGDIGPFFLLSQSSIAAGVRRFEGIVGTHALKALRENGTTLQGVCDLLKVKEDKLLLKIDALLKDVKVLKRERRTFIKEQNISLALNLLQSNFHKRIITHLLDRSLSDPREAMSDIGDEIVARSPEKAVAIGSIELGQILLRSGKKAPTELSAKKIAEEVILLSGGKGGGNNESAMVGGLLPSLILQTLVSIEGKLGHVDV